MSQKVFSIFHGEYLFQNALVLQGIAKYFISQNIHLKVLKDQIPRIHLFLSWMLTTCSY